MARIVNVIKDKHLVTYKCYSESEHRCCGVCNYKVFVETDEGELLIASEWDDSSLLDFNIEEFVERWKKSDWEQKEDIAYPFNRTIEVEDINDFILGEIESLTENAFDAFFSVTQKIRESGVCCSNEVEEILKKIQL